MIHTPTKTNHSTSLYSMPICKAEIMLTCFTEPLEEFKKHLFCILKTWNALKMQNTFIPGLGDFCVVTKVLSTWQEWFLLQWFGQLPVSVGFIISLSWLGLSPLRERCLLWGGSSLQIIGSEFLVGHSRDSSSAKGSSPDKAGPALPAQAQTELLPNYGENMKGKGIEGQNQWEHTLREERFNN